MAEPEFLSLLRVLFDHDVRFVVVGGVAAVLHGAPVFTRDLDVLYALDDDNVARVLAALAVLDARFRERPDLRPDRSHVASRGHKLLLTRLGPLDLLGHVGAGQTFEDLVPTSSVVQVSGLDVPVLDLQELIRLKEELGHPKDAAMLPTLRATLARQRGDG